jgi:hypothetical protein
VLAADDDGGGFNAHVLPPRLPTQVFDRCVARNPRLKAALEREGLLPSTDQLKAQYGAARAWDAVKRCVGLVTPPPTHSQAARGVRRGADAGASGFGDAAVTELLKSKRAAAANAPAPHQWQPSTRTATMLARLASRRAVVRRSPAEPPALKPGLRQNAPPHHTAWHLLAS